MVETKFKHTDIGLIPENWEVKRINEIANVYGGGTPSTKNPIFWNGDINWFTPTEVGNTKYLLNSLRKITEIGLNNSSAKILPAGTILMTTRAGIGDLGILKLPSATNQGFQSLIPLENINGEYLFYLALTLKPALLQNASGSTFLEISPSKVKSIQIPLPPLPEQKAIAEVLSDTDTWIESLEKLIAKKQFIKQGAMQKLLTPKEDWEVKKLGEVCDVRDGTHDSPKYFDSGVKFITSKNIVNNKLDFAEISYISFSDATEINKRSKVDKNDIIMSMIGTIGNAVLIDFEPDFCIKNVALLKPRNISSTFLIQMIKSPYFQNLLNSKMDGGIQKFVSLGVLRDLKFNCPKFLSEQERIAAILFDMDVEIEMLEKKLTKAKQIKQGLMQELLTGRIRLV
ncbi:restriction endonuclease subunit S [Elizabethkingia anophelis]|jgi:type I restriction enzyme S subunit|nr:restriction endonuclease subunit S [Elizabethkingia anophelis]